VLETFDVSLVVGPTNELWVSAYSRHGAVHGVPRAGGNLPSVAELDDVTLDFQDAIQYARPFRGTDVGAALRDLVFGEPDIAALFHRGRGAAADHGRQVVVRILAAPGRLAAVPWELILDPEDPEGGSHQYLTLAPDVHVVRAARSRTYPVPSTPLQPPLNVLLVLSSPVRWEQNEDAMSFDLFEEKRNLLQELEALQYSDILRIDVEEHPTLENLRRRIGSRRGGYHIVHYLGHAAPGGLYLEDRFGRAALAPAEAVTALLRLCPQLRLSLFAGCETATTPAATVTLSHEWRQGLSTADQCVRVSCPTVIGMRAVLPFRTEWLFARFFYQGLASGYAVVDAVRLARAAIRGDEFVGGDLLDWAVPSVIAGSDQLGPLLEPAKPGLRAPRRTVAELKFDVVEEDREFFSRLVQLRQAIDVLGGIAPGRVLIVTGPSGVGKTALVDRALQDLGTGLDGVLYFKATRLQKEKDPVLRLAGWVGEVLTMFDQRPRVRPPEIDGSGWWERLLSDLTTTRFVIVIDDLQVLRESDAATQLLASLTRAIQQLADRRGSCRLALIGSDLPDGLIDARASHVTTLRLQPFSWDEMWVWVRRNLPVLTRYGKAGLGDYYAQLGNDLASWRDLGSRVGQQTGAVDLQGLVKAIANSHRRVTPATAAAPAPTPLRTQRALRVAVAGPYIKSPEAFAQAMTKLAAHYAVGGRIVTSDQTTVSALAELLPIPSPLAQEVLPTPPPAGERFKVQETILQWLHSLEALKPDIVLLDYGFQKAVEAHNEIIARLASSALIVAAAGNEGEGSKVRYPARIPDVLAVGALTSDDRVADYSSLALASGKPELHALGNLRETPLESAITEPDAQGTTFSAILVAAAAALAWSINPARDRLWLREVLLDSSKTIYLNGTSVRGLDIEKALTLARASAVLDALGSGEVAYAELQGGVGFSAAVLDPVLQYLLDQNKIRFREDLGVRLYSPVEPSQRTTAPSPAAPSPIPPSASQPEPPSSQSLTPSPPRAKPKRASSRPRTGTNRSRGR
jgi:hypothetical protein